MQIILLGRDGMGRVGRDGRDGAGWGGEHLLTGGEG